MGPNSNEPFGGKAGRSWLKLAGPFVCVIPVAGSRTYVMGRGRCPVHVSKTSANSSNSYLAINSTSEPTGLSETQAIQL